MTRHVSANLHSFPFELQTQTLDKLTLFREKVKTRLFILSTDIQNTQPLTT